MSENSDQLNLNNITTEQTVTHKPWNILADHYGTKIDEKFIHKLQKGSKNVSREVKNSCKVLQVSSEWNYEEFLAMLGGLDAKEYTNLFVIIIEGKNFEFLEENLENVKKIKEKLGKLGPGRPLVLQLTSEDEKLSKFYYKEAGTDKFMENDLWKEKHDKIQDFPLLLCSFLGADSTSIDQLTAGWKQIIKLPLAIKFLKLFEFIYKKLILEVTKSGTNADLLTVLEAPVEHEGRVLSVEAQAIISELIPDSLPDKNSSNHANDEQALSKDESSNESDDEYALMDELVSSVLLTAVEHKNIEVIDHLITYWTHLIQELSFDHQIRISTAAFKSDQLDVLCDLLEIADFPFPKNYEPDEQEHKRLKKITQDRMDFTIAIKKENFKEIDTFIDENWNLKCVYSIINGTALTQAVVCKNFGVFYYLKSLGFQGEYCEDVLDKLDDENRKNAAQQAVKQRKTNVNQAKVDVHKSVMLLGTRSLIHNRRISKEQEAEYRQKIINWLHDIHKIAPEMLDVAASCEYLKIIFDFESNTVENASLAGSNASGSTYPTSKWIFISSQSSDKKREQQIKGVLAHELCHYVMRLVYENQENPYYKDKVDVKEMFEGIVKAIDKWSGENAEGPDDECNGIISTVFTSYNLEDFHPELIVRVVQILNEFDDDEDRTRHLQEKYQDLFNFWHNQVVPELQKNLQKNQDVKKLNGFIGLLPKILKHKIEVKSCDEIETALGSKMAVVTTNIPALLFVDICEVLQQKDGILMDSKNLFVDPEKLNNLEIWILFKQISRDVTELNIIVDCTKGVPANLGNIFINLEFNFIFVVSNDDQCKELAKIFEQKELKDATKMKINYNWNDLTEESQKLLLKTKINFQNNLEIALTDILEGTKSSLDAGMDNLPDLCEIIDDELLNLIINNEKLAINLTNESDLNERSFKFINMERKFLSKKPEEEEKQPIYSDADSRTVQDQNPPKWTKFLNFRRIFNENKSKQQEKNSDSDDETSDTEEEHKISQEELLSETKNQKHVLISDMAGNGKSWAMKNFTKILREQNSTSWVTYVDLKQFIKEFKAQEGQEVIPEFSTFLVEKILRTEHKFESKIFQKLYKDGKVFILFDGFDEIAPNCAEFVSNLAQSFQSNEGNQLWIATRDYFEVNLKEKLKIEVAYGLEEMNNKQGIELIAKSWILKDLSDNKADMTREKFNKQVQESPNFKEYKGKAEQIVRKVIKISKSSVGMPQMFKMIADGFKNEKNLENLTRSKIYEKFIKNLYRRWSREKGEIREDASIEGLNQRFKFWEFHQYHAILSMFPELANILFPEYNGKDWKVEEVIACGILSTKNGEYFFIHETLREYFVADALMKALKNEKVDEKVFEVFVDVLTLEQYKIIRMFLNDSIDSTISERIQTQIKKFFEKFWKTKNLNLIFAENLENLVEIFLSILKDGDYKKVKEILNRDCKSIVKETKSSKLFFELQEFFCQFLTNKDLKNLIKDEKIFKAIIEGELRIKVFADFVLKIESKTGHEFVQKELRKAISEKRLQEDDFKFFFNVEDPEAFKFQKFLEMMKKFLSPTEMLEFFKKKAGWRDENILSFCVRKENKEILRILWTEIENYFTVQNMSQDFKELVMQQDNYKENILHKIIDSTNLKIHKILWELLLNIFKDYREELKDFVLQKNYLGNNFIHQLVCKNKNPEIIKWTFKMLKENFNESQFQKIIQSRGRYNRNLIHSAAQEGHNIENFKHLWKLFHSSFKSEQEFREALKEADETGCNILAYAAKYSLVEVFDFLIEEFEENCSREEVKKMLSNLKLNQNLLHYAAQNESSDAFKAVWTNFQNYFDQEEILEIAKHVGRYKSANFLFVVKSSETFEFAIEELEKIGTRDEVRNMLSSRNGENQNILQNAIYRIKSIKLNERLWKTLRKYFENSEIKHFINNVDEDGYNLLHLAVSGLIEKEVVELTWNEIKTFLNRDEQIKYLKTKRRKGKNLIKFSWKDETELWMRKLFKEYEIQF